MRFYVYINVYKYIYIDVILSFAHTHFEYINEMCDQKYMFRNKIFF